MDALRAPLVAPAAPQSVLVTWLGRTAGFAAATVALLALTVAGHTSAGGQVHARGLLAGLGIAAATVLLAGAIDRGGRWSTVCTSAVLVAGQLALHRSFGHGGGPSTAHAAMPGGMPAGHVHHVGHDMLASPAAAPAGPVALMLAFHVLAVPLSLLVVRHVGSVARRLATVVVRRLLEPVPTVPVRAVGSERRPTVQPPQRSPQSTPRAFPGARRAPPAPVPA